MGRTSAAVPQAGRLAPGRLTRRTSLAKAKTNLSIHVVPHHDPVNLYYRSSRLISRGERLIADTADMVQQVLSLKTKHGLPVGQLTITGHGNPTGFYIGSDWVTQETLVCGNSVADELAKLNGVFDSNALVLIRACDTGESEDLLMGLSMMLGGVRVRGSRWKQLGIIPDLTGNEVECTINSYYRPSHPGPIFPVMPRPLDPNDMT